MAGVKRRAGASTNEDGLERTFIAAMGGLLYPIGDLLVRQPGPDGANAAPAFGFYRFDDASSKKEQLTVLCDAVLGDYRRSAATTACAS